jgi:hypothetical protein
MIPSIIGTSGWGWPVVSEVASNHMLLFNKSAVSDSVTPCAQMARTAIIVAICVAVAACAAAQQEPVKV